MEKNKTINRQTVLLKIISEQKNGSSVLRTVEKCIDEWNRILFERLFSKDMSDEDILHEIKQIKSSI